MNTHHDLVEHVIGVVHAVFGAHCGRIACLARDSTRIYPPRHIDGNSFVCCFTQDHTELVSVRFRVYNTRLSRPQQTKKYVIHSSFLALLYALFLVAHSGTATATKQTRQATEWLHATFS